MSIIADLGLPLDMPKSKAVELGDAARVSREAFKAAAEPSAAEIFRQLTETLAAYRAGRSDLQRPAIPASEMYLLINRFRDREFSGAVGAKIAAVIAEINDELVTAMPGRPRAQRNWA